MEERVGRGEKRSSERGGGGEDTVRARPWGKGASRALAGKVLQTETKKKMKKKSHIKG